MKHTMFMEICRFGCIITYRCYHLPGHGKKCADKNTDKCLRCKYSRAEMNGETATRLMNVYGAKMRGDA